MSISLNSPFLFDSMDSAVSWGSASTSSCSSFDGEPYIATSDITELFPDIDGVSKAEGGGETLSNVINVGGKTTKVVKVNMSADEEKDFLRYLCGGQIEDGQPAALQLVINDEKRETETLSKPIIYQAVNNIMPGNMNSTQGKIIKIPYNPNVPPPRLSTSKNALAARENRQKKKQYVEGLEESNQKLKSQNENLISQSEKLMATVKTLSSEVQYLRSVIANQSALSNLLKNIHNTPGVVFGSSFDQQLKEQPQVSTATQNKSMATENKSTATQNKRKENEESGSPQHESPRTTRAKKKLKIDDTPSKPCIGNSDKNNNGMRNVKSTNQDIAGICLHVSKGHVSLEFCAQCSNNSEGARTSNLEDNEIIVVDS